MNRISKSHNLILLLLTLALLSILAIAANACSNEEIKFDGPYPNTIAENATISEQYKELAEKLSYATLQEFYEITKIPRESGNMDGIRNYLLNWAKTNNINAVLDKSGCIYIDLPASPGCENYKNLIIQSHMDMVINYDESLSNFDPYTTPLEIDYNEETGEAHSKDFKTNIGADNGQGLGLSLALAKYGENYKHGRIRILFTYDEETTMEGSDKLTEDVLDADYLINFDCPRCGVAAVGCAGDFPIVFDKKYAVAGPTEKNQSENLTISVNGLTGGHSGLDINKGRCSASAFLIDYLNELKNNTVHFRIAEINCGDMINGIPDSFKLTLNINKKNEEQAKQLFEELANKKKAEFENDNNFDFKIEVSAAAGTFPSKQDSEKILDVLNSIPNGIIKMSDKYKDAVETSCNIGIITLKEGQFHCAAHYRSSSNETLLNESKEISDNLKSLKIECAIPEYYITPAWSPEETSLSKMYQKAMKNECGINASLISPHAGTELSIFNLKKPEMKMISIGGDVKDEHMLTETFYLKSFPAAVLPVIYIIDHAAELD